MNRRVLLKSTLATLMAGTAGCSRKRQPLPKLDTLETLADLSSQLQSQSGNTTATQLLSHFLDRVAYLDLSGPNLRSVIEVNPEAAAIADRLDAELRAHRSLGPLHGLPILLKDNIDTADNMETTAGSLALLGQKKPSRNATIVTKLRDAGMLIVGKANLSEWANIRSPDSTSGWSARGGLTRNPHKLTHSASGSSSGSAVAVAAGLVPAAIGTETNGSIVSPASACGIVGLKPTLGLISRSGIIPITQWQDTAGPMTLTVRDAAMLLNVLAGVDEFDPHTGPAGQGHIAQDYTALLKPDALRGARLGIVRSLCGENPQVLAVLETALEKLSVAGAEIIEVAELPNEKVIGRLSMHAMLTELRSDLNAYLTSRGADIKSLADIIAFNEAHRDQEMPHFKQEFFEQAERCCTPTAIDEANEARAESRRLAGPEGIDATLKEHRLDALICATNDPAEAIDLPRGDPNVRCACTPAAVAGYPHLTVPMGFVESMPIGLSFFSTAWTESHLLAYGHAFEQIHPARRRPAGI